jgi:uncharacterized protein (TIGR03083 family)
MRTHLSKDFWLAALRADGAALRAAVLEPGALASQTPSCPEWTVGDLLRHMGTMYQKLRAHAGRGVTDAPAPFTPTDPAPGDDHALIAWFDNELAQTDAFLDALDPGMPAWNWAPQAKTAAFWHRRAAHETALHRWDAQLSVALADPIEAKLAVDGVAEVLDTWLLAGKRADTTEHFGVVRLIAADLGQEWYVRMRGTGIALLDTDTLLDDDVHRARAVASGSASDLMLALWGRVAFDVLDTSGDLSLLRGLRVNCDR